MPTKIHPLVPPQAIPANPSASPRTRALLAFLDRQYGKLTLSGQHEFDDTRYVRATTGKLPAIIGGDFIEYSPSRVAHGSNPNGESERIIAAGKAGQIVTMMWHWNAPTDLIDKIETGADGTPVNHLWYFGFYTYGTTFSLEKVIDHPSSPDYQLLLRDMDVIAAQLQKFQDAGIPVTWRPLHEAEGGWFWWGASGPDAYKKLWRLMFDRFTYVHHLNNLLWVYTSGGNPDWYPGDRYVDVVGIDAYPRDLTDPGSEMWKTLYKQYGGRKLLTLSEFGGARDIPKMKELGARWSYFYSWSGDVGPHKNSTESLQWIYNSRFVVTADKLPKRLP